MNVLKKNIPTLSLLALLLLSTPFVVFAQEGAIEKTLWFIANGVFGTLFGLAGMLLDWGIKDFVIGFGDSFTKPGGVGFVVDALWVNVRDLFNITFIFGLVYIGFKMILDSDDSNTKRWLINLIMAAILVNFSLYITKLIVDLANITASQIAINGFETGSKEISEQFMNYLGINSVWGLDKIPSLEGGAYGYIFGAAILFIVGTFVFAAGGIMLIFRYGMLCLYMVLSPLMFIGWVFPQLQSETSKYWKGFLGRAFFAPLYLLLLFFSLKVIAGFYGADNSSPAFHKLFVGGGDNIEPSFSTTLPPFILSCFFMIASVVVANKLGADGASQALRIGNNLRGRAQRGLQRTAIGATRFTASQTAGRIARPLSNVAGNYANKQITKWQEGRGSVIMGALANTVAGDTIMRGAATKMKGAKFGLANTSDEERAKKDAINKRNENAEITRRGVSAQEELDKEKETTGSIATTGQIWDQSQGKMVNRSTLTPDEIKVLLEQNAAKMQSVVTGYSDKQLEEMFNNDREKFDSIVGHLKASQFDKLVSSDGIPQTEKGKMLSLRQKTIEKRTVKSLLRSSKTSPSNKLRQWETTSFAKTHTYSLKARWNLLRRAVRSPKARRAPILAPERRIRLIWQTIHTDWSNCSNTTLEVQPVVIQKKRKRLKSPVFHSKCLLIVAEHQMMSL